MAVRRSYGNVSLRRLSMDPSMLSNGYSNGDSGSPQGSPGSSPRSQRRASLTGEHSDVEMLQFWQEQALLPLKEDLADWLFKVLDIDITPDNFMSVLDSGVYICRLAKIIQNKAEEYGQNGGKTDQKLVGTKIRYRETAKSGTWFARDNIANFLQWARDSGVKEECMFETEGLVSHRDPKNVLLCLLELARIGHKFGLDPPGLVQLEKEIEMEEKGLSNGKESVSPADSRSSSPRDSRPCTPKTSGIPRPSSASTGRARQRSGSLSSERPLAVKGTPRAIATPRATPRGSTNRRPSAQTNGKTPAKTPARTPMHGIKRKIDLDREVQKMTSGCKCPQCYKIERIAEGKYCVGGRILYIRLLKDKHVMVRVGGGWDTLEHYLATHDPCKMREVSRSTSLQSMPEPIEDRFLLIQGKYKHLQPT